MIVSCYDNRMIQGFVNFFQCIASCMLCCTKKEPALSEQVYGELETPPYAEEFTHVDD